MKVVVRVRPSNGKESDTRMVVRVVDDQGLIFDPKEDLDEFFFQGVKQKFRDIRKKANKDQQFVFDRVFDANSTNDEVYEHTTKSILDGLLDGYNCSVFAYGATGAGKTFTMLGNVENPGITFLTMMELFRRIETVKRDKHVEVFVSYLEVYNENIHDLLASSSNLQLREDPQRGVIVTGLKMHKPQCAEELLDMLQQGNLRRTQHPTDANSESSRSHAIFTVYLKQQENSGRQVALRSSLSKMSLIDLAGSERATMLSASNKGSRMREGANINKSLLALGNCINALAGRTAMSKAHIPYRNSKLTRLLKDSLGGNCCTVMIAAVSPSVNSFDDTYNTLKYADRAKSIKMNFKQNVVNNELHTIQYVKMIDDLRAQVSQLKAELQLARSGSAALVPSSTQLSLSDATAGSDEVKPVPVSELTSVFVPPNPNAELKIRLQEMFDERHDAQRDYLQVISQVRELELRIQHRLRKVKNLKLVSVDTELLERSSEKADQAVQSMHFRLETLIGRKSILEDRILCNQHRFEELDTTTLPQELQDWVNLQRLEIELQNRKHQNRHLRRLVVNLNREECTTNQIVANCICILKRQYAILKVNGLATSDVEEDYDSITRQVEGYRGVAWADLQPEEQSNAKDAVATSTSSTFADIVDLPLLSLNGAVKDDLKSCTSAMVKTTSIKRHPLSPLCVSNGGATVDSTVKTNGNAFKKLKLGPTPPRCQSDSMKKPCVPEAQVADSTFVLSPTLPNVSPLLQHNTAEDNGSVFSTIAAESLVPLPPKTDKRRLTFDTPGPSILKVSQDMGDSTVMMDLPVSDCPSSASNASEVGLNGCKTQTVAKLSSIFRKSVSSTNLSKVEHLRKHGSTSMLNRPDGLSKSVVSDAKKSELRLSGFKIRAPKNSCDSSTENKALPSRCPRRAHPYQSVPPVPQRVKISESRMDGLDVPVKKSKTSTATSAGNIVQQCSGIGKQMLLLPNQLVKSTALSRQRSQSTSNMRSVSLENANGYK